MLQFTPQIVPDNVVIVGCGGTGSRVLPLIAQSLAGQEWMLKKRITLIDDDVVEEKNLKRQLFIQPDLGRNKAEVLAERYGNAFNMDIQHIPQRLPVAGKNFAALLKDLWGGETSEHVTLILCVDSVEARLDILRYALDGFGSDSIIIDTGNEDTFGQVEYFNNTLHTGISSGIKNKASTIEERSGFNQELTQIPMPIYRYLDTAEGEGTGSCADLDQTLAINNLVAANVAAIFQNLIYSIPMEFRLLRVSLNGGSSTEWLDNNWLKYQFNVGEVGGAVLTRKTDRGNLLHRKHRSFKTILDNIDAGGGSQNINLINCVESVCTKQAMELAGEEVPA